MVSPKLLELKVTYRCNSRCEYCCAGNRREYSTMGLDEILANVDWFVERFGIRGICLSGGEPSVHRNFQETLQAVADRGLSIYLHTNAIRFQDALFAESCVRFLQRVLVGFSCHDEDMCRLITGTTATFDRRIAGIRNLLRGSISVRTNTVMLKQNYRRLPEIAEVVCETGVDRSLLTFPFFFEPRSAQLDEFVPESLDEVKPYLVRAVEILRNRRIAVSIQGLPACKLGDLAEFREIDPDRVFVDSRHQFDKHQMLFSGALGYFKKEGCRDCKFEPECWGFPRPGAFGKLGELIGLLH